jgi:hypothetical protein
MHNLQSKKDIVSLFPKNYFNERNVIASLHNSHNNSHNDSHNSYNSHNSHNDSHNNSHKSYKSYNNYEPLNPFAIKLYTLPEKHIYELWDLTSFRPDILDNDVFVKKLEKGAQVVILYENLTSFEMKNVEIPRYIIWKNYVFVNVR